MARGYITNPKTGEVKMIVGDYLKVIKILRQHFVPDKEKAVTQKGNG